MTYLFSANLVCFSFFSHTRRLNKHYYFCIKHNSHTLHTDTSQTEEISCDANNCDKKECWICCKCYKILCGRYANKHMLEHYKTETNGDHCIAMSMGDSEFWCFKCLILKIPLNEIPDEVKDDVMGAYLDDGAIAPVYEFYEQAHLAHWGELPPTSKKKNDTGQEKKEMADIAEEINTEFNEKEDSLAKVPNLSANKISVPKDENLNKVGIFYHEAMTLHKCEDHDHVERPGRISVSYENLKYYGLLDKCKEYKCNEIDPKLIKYTHPKKHIEKILRGYDPTKKKSKPKDLDPGQVDGDTFYNQHTPKASLVTSYFILFWFVCILCFFFCVFIFVLFYFILFWFVCIL